MELLMHVTSSLPSVAALSSLQGEVDLGAPGQREQDFGDVKFSSMAVMRAAGSQEQQQKSTPEAEFCHQGPVSLTSAWAGGIIHSGPTVLQENSRKEMF